MCPIEGFEKCGKSIRSGDTKEVDTIDEEVHAITMEVDNITKVVDAITKEVFTITKEVRGQRLHRTQII